MRKDYSRIRNREGKLVISKYLDDMVKGLFKKWTHLHTVVLLQLFYRIANDNVVSTAD